MGKPLKITFNLSADDDGYNVGDWFKGGWETILLAENAASIEDANKILNDNYLGPDRDDVVVFWDFE